MGGGNAQKAKMARERNLEKMKASNKGSQMDANKKAMTIQGYCGINTERQTFIDRQLSNAAIYSQGNGYFSLHTVQGAYADIHRHYFGGEMLRTC